MSKTTTIRVTRQAYNNLKAVAEQEHASMQDMLDKLLANYETKTFFEELNRSVLAVKEQPEVWAEELDERKAWEATLSDGLEEKEHETW